ncbi:contractile injection system protein, VgrG/Pvc8 family [Halapricum sp. CBA1109]|uniref:contractile injection system protein, VgrG/Pvc8 family n=1 Tax=Halapricum sp. CBA1109 TaxID=2668068 RepID=UPI0018D249E7|nr:contractile injection system protein, VgrG/Pvc8 family [Halapricum sp. CBA1109]
MTGTEPRYAPRYRMELGDRQFDGTGGAVGDLVVETTVDGADRFAATLQYPFEDGSFRGLPWESLAAGTDVSIAMGYGDDLTPLFSGRVDGVRASFDRSTAPSVTVTGFGRLRATMTGTDSRSWRETTLGDVVESVLSPYAFDSLDVAASVEREWLFQDNRSDYRFLAALAETYGFRFYARRDTAVFRPRGERRVRSTRPRRSGTATDSASSTANAAGTGRRLSRSGRGTPTGERNTSPRPGRRTRTRPRCSEFQL